MDKGHEGYMHNGIYSALKNNKIVSFAGKWVELGIVM
jgi:hypothetical protein